MRIFQTGLFSLSEKHNGLKKTDFIQIKYPVHPSYMFISVIATCLYMELSAKVCTPWDKEQRFSSRFHKSFTITNGPIFYVNELIMEIISNYIYNNLYSMSIFCLSYSLSLYYYIILYYISIIIFFQTGSYIFLSFLVIFPPS